MRPGRGGGDEVNTLISQSLLTYALGSQHEDPVRCQQVESRSLRLCDLRNSSICQSASKCLEILNQKVAKIKGL